MITLNILNINYLSKYNVKYLMKHFLRLYNLLTLRKIEKCPCQIKG